MAAGMAPWNHSIAPLRPRSSLGVSSPRSHSRPRPPRFPASRPGQPPALADASSEDPAPHWLVRPTAAPLGTRTGARWAEKARPLSRDHARRQGSRAPVPCLLGKSAGARARDASGSDSRKGKEASGRMTNRYGTSASPAVRLPGNCSLSRLAYFVAVEL